MLKVSIIIPIYNKERYLETTIKSAINQTMKNDDYEIILVNNGSTDRSEEIAKKYEENNKNIRLISQENRGVSGSCNTGILNATGEYIYILHADDRMKSNLLEISYKIAKDNDLDVVHFGYVAIHNYNKDFCNNMDIGDGEMFLFNNLPENSIISGEEFFKKSPWPGPTFTFLYKREFIIKNNLFFDEMLCIEDTEYYPRLYLKIKKAIHLSRALYEYTINENNTSQIFTSDKKYYNSIQISLYKYCDLIINNEKKKKDIFKKYFWMLFNNLKEWCCKLNNIDRNLCVTNLYNNFLDKYIQCFGNNVSNEELYDFMIIYLSYIEFNQDMGKINIRVKDLFKYMKENIDGKLFKIPFNKKDVVIGIYGVGEHTENIMKYYNKNFGEISATLKYIDTFKGKKDEMYAGNLIINVENINNYKLDCIFVSSTCFEEEIYYTAQKNLIHKVPIYTLYNSNFIF